MKNLNIPSHIAIIVDGNRRWAKKRGLPDSLGHKAGFDRVEPLATAANKAGVKCVTCWVFSTENWKRKKDEVDFIFSLANDIASKFRDKFVREKIRFVHLGRKDRIPSKLKEEIDETERLTKDFTGFTFAVALDYGGHDEIIRTIKKLNENHLEIDKENIEKYLDTSSLPQLDLIIRTGGECRLSGFMPWQSEYAEYYFTNVLFPDFDDKEFEKAIEDYCGRERRFGGDPNPKTS